MKILSIEVTNGFSIQSEFADNGIIHAGFMTLLGAGHSELKSMRYFKVTRTEDIEKKVIAQFYLSPFPGNCGMVVIHHAMFAMGERDKKLGQALLPVVEKLAFDLGYTVMTCTTASVFGVANPRVDHILGKQGWKITQQFTNKRTNNTCTIWVKNIREQ